MTGPVYQFKDGESFPDLPLTPPEREDRDSEVFTEDASDEDMAEYYREMGRGE